MALFSVRDLSKTFPPRLAALSGVNLDIEKGECLVISGANGSGKTVLMKIIAGLLPPTSGEVLFEGRPLASAMSGGRPHAGLVFQDADAQIIGETVAEDVILGPANLGMTKDEARERTLAAMRDCGIEAKADFPSRSLSGGEKRRLAVAGVLAMGCETVIMDEPFANLDYPGVRSVLQIIAQLKRDGRTLVILTHELEKTLALADRLAVLHEGRVALDDRPEAALDRLKPEFGIRDPRRTYRDIRDLSWL
jgi:biotin transport system ATP-binding protein